MNITNNRALSRETAQNARKIVLQALGQFRDPHLTPARILRTANVPPLRTAIRFRRAFGHSLATHLTLLRVAAATEAMIGADPRDPDPLTTIAQTAGFTDAAALGRAFRRHRQTSSYEALLRISAARDRPRPEQD
ncbi:helix-turn-helix domain-containing protein [Microbacteriaceae bacterium VKM Ac-2854]|nr:helix-turn-helix domain-containing protein [Microbacteriaceae bacterium VKM Ac-2854]